MGPYTAEGEGMPRCGRGSVPQCFGYSLYRVYREISPEP